MSYYIHWGLRARRRLDIWTFLALETGRDADAIARAVVEIESLLVTNPASQGESREGNERVVVVPPLTVQFEVFESDRAVVIFDVIYHTSRR